MPQSQFLKIHFNIILQSTLVLSKLSVSLRFPQQTPCSPHTCYMSRPSHFLGLVMRIIFGERYRSLSSLLCSPPPCYLIPLRPKYPPQHSTLEQPHLMFLPQYARLSFTPIQKNMQHNSPVNFDIIFSDSNLEDEIFCTECA